MRVKVFTLRVVAGFCILLLFGCASRNIYKDASYDAVLDSVHIQFVATTFMPTSQQGLHIVANQNVAFMQAKVPQLLKFSFETKGVYVPTNILQETSPGKVILIRAADMKRSCTYGTNTYNYGRVISCDDEVWYRVSLLDSAVGHLVWSGEFKIDGRISVYDSDRQQAELQRFLKEIINALVEAKLLKK